MDSFGENQHGEVQRGVKKTLPITIVEYHNVGSGQIDTQTSSTRRKKEDELFTIGFVILVNSHNSIFVRCTTIDSAVFCSGVRLRLPKGTGASNLL